MKVYSVMTDFSDSYDGQYDSTDVDANVYDSLDAAKRRMAELADGAQSRWSECYGDNFVRRQDNEDGMTSLVLCYENLRYEARVIEFNYIGS